MRMPSYPSPWRAKCRCSNTTRVAPGPSAVHSTVISLALSGSGSGCHCGVSCHVSPSRWGGGAVPRPGRAPSPARYVGASLKTAPVAVRLDDDGVEGVARPGVFRRPPRRHAPRERHESQFRRRQDRCFDPYRVVICLLCHVVCRAPVPTMAIDAHGGRTSRRARTRSNGGLPPTVNCGVMSGYLKTRTGALGHRASLRTHARCPISLK